MAAYVFLLMLLVANSMAIWDSNFGIRNRSPGRARAFECTAPGLYCETCTNSVFCTPDLIATPIPCDPGQVCGGDAPASGCIPYTGTTSAGDCDCDTIGNSGFLVDPYDPSKYIFCIPADSQFFLSCAEGETYSTVENSCMQVEDVTSVAQTNSTIDCLTTSIGFHTNDPTCQTYTACYIVNLPGLLLACADGEAFDTSLLRCVPKCDLAPAAFSCPAGASGALPDTSDCAIFHVCSAGAAVTPSTGVPCPDGQVFESMSMTCVAPSSDVICPEVNTCWSAHCDACGGTCPATISIADTTTSSTTSSTTPTTTTPTTTTPTTTTPTTTTPTITTPTTTTPTTTTPITTTPTTTTPTTTTPTTTTPTTTTPTTTTPTTTTPTTTTPTTTTPTTTTPTTTRPTTTTPTTTTTTATTTTSTTAATGPPDCNNSQGYFENSADCKKFYSCQSNDAGGYELVEYRCPGSLVYIPSLNYCSLQADLPAAPGCITS